MKLMEIKSLSLTLAHDRVCYIIPQVLGLKLKIGSRGHMQQLIA